MRSDDMESINVVSEGNWEFLKRFLPVGWDGQMLKLGLLKFGRKFAGDEGPAALLRLMLIHLACNVSLRSACVIAKRAGIIDVSDVALIKRFKKSQAWFEWATAALSEQMPSARRWPEADSLTGYQFRLIDATTVEEPGDTGAKWRLHFAMDARTMSADEIRVDDHHVGESLVNFTVKPGDVFIGDRVYARRRGIAYVVANNGHVLCRLAPRNLPMIDGNGKPVDLLSQLRQLSDGQIGDISAYISSHGKLIPVRVCAIRQHPGATEDATRRIRRKASKKGVRNVRPDTLEYAGYFLVVTTLPACISAESILAIYRYRWQIELFFKRLKSLLRLSPLHKRSKPSMLGWLSGKIFTVTLIDFLRHYGEAFSPWGYPLPGDRIPAPSRAPHDS